MSGGSISFVLGICLLLVMAGCVTNPEAPPETSTKLPERPPVPSNETGPKTPNYLGDWSNLTGNFSFYRMTTKVERFNTSSQQKVPYSNCIRPLFYKLDLVNRTLNASSNIALHPSEPGTLRIVYINEVLLAEKCSYGNLMGLNDNGTRRGWCTRPSSAEDGQESVPWECNLPVDYTSHVGALWENVSFVPSESIPNAFDVIFNGNRYAGNAPFNVTIEATDPTRPGLFYRGNATMEPLGDFSYASITRF